MGKDSIAYEQRKGGCWLKVYSEKMSELFGLSGDEIVQRMENYYDDNSDAEKNPGESLCLN